MARRDDEGTAVLDRPVGGASTNGSDTGDVPASDTSTSTTTRAKRERRDPATLGPNEMISLNVRVPNALRVQLAKTAEEQKTSVPGLVSGMLASAYGYELPKSTRAPRTKKYANAEERIAAQKAAQQKQRAITRAILKAVEEGKIDVNIEELMAQVSGGN